MKTAGVILAAGLGKRMHSTLPKVLHKIHDAPMLHYVLKTLRQLTPQKTVVVVGKHFYEIKKSLPDDGSISFVIQKEAKGTGDALLTTWQALKGFEGTVLVLNGDTPLVTRETLKKFLSLHKKHKDVISVLSFMTHEPSSYGRIVRDKNGMLTCIVEEKDATAHQKHVKEVNSGIYAIERDAFPMLREIRLNKLRGEYYLTDIVGIAKQKGVKVGAYCIGSEDELMGVNTQKELEKARKLMRDQIIKKWVDRGVTFIDTTLVYISPQTTIGKGTRIYPNVYLEGSTRIGKECTIYPNVRIHNGAIGNRATIKDSTLIDGSIVRSGASVGPFTHIRPGSEIGKGAKIGNFVEVKKSVIGSGTKASHLTYLGDSKLGKNVNIGAGTITCNYDGIQKHVTIIEDNVFVGSDTQFIAPVKIGKGAYIGAGSTITKDVPPMALALSRVRQKHIEGWAKKKLKIKKEKLKIEKHEKE